MPSEHEILVHSIDNDEDFTSAFTIRTEVFVEEEHVDAETEYDGFDHLANHYLATLDGKAAGAARWRAIPGSGRIKLERLSVLKEFRRRGVGTALILHMLEDIPKNSEKEVFIHVPLQYLGMFQTLGFHEEGEIFEEAGMDHKKMVLNARHES